MQRPRGSGEADGRKHRRRAVQSTEGEEAERREEAPWASGEEFEL